jgi:hypothetical protein
MPEEEKAKKPLRLTKETKTVWDFLVVVAMSLPMWARFVTLLILLGGATFLLSKGLLPIPWLAKGVSPTLSKAITLPERAQRVGTTSSSAPLPTTPPIGSLKVAVFYPDPSLKGAPYEDGKVQLQGFQSTSDDYPDARLETYRFPAENDNRSFKAELMPKIQDLYKNGYRIFIVTMSAASTGIKTAFKEWATQYKGNDDAPILIATVASAPGIADAEAGIFRFYVRSQEEASELARYAAWKDGLEKVGVFYVDDPYGEGGRDTFNHEFHLDLGRQTENYDVQKSGSNASQRVREFMVRAQTARVGAFVVGYDAMLRETVEDLVKSGFRGPILCSSTLTAPAWQPRVNTDGHEIVTVVPHRDGPHAQAEDNVVFFFSRITLRRALQCASQSRTAREFTLHWQRQGNDNGGIEAHHLVDGDAIIPMAVTSQWRAKDIQ